MPVTVGVDSYVTEAELTAYALARGVTVTSGDESILLIRGMDYIESYRYEGCKTDLDQPLEWPRIGMTDGCDVIQSDEIPDRVKRAQMEAAIRASAGNLLADQSPGAVKREKVGPIEVEYSEFSNDGITRYPVIDRLLSPFLGARGRYQQKLVRT